VTSAEGKKDDEAKAIVLATGSSTSRSPLSSLPGRHRRPKEAVSLRGSPSACSSRGGVIGSSSAASTKLGRLITVVEMTPTLVPVPIPTAPRRPNAEMVGSARDLEECKAMGTRLKRRFARGSASSRWQTRDDRNRLRPGCGRYEAQFEGSRTRKGRSQNRRARVRSHRQVRPHQVPSIYAIATSAVRLCSAHKASKRSRDRRRGHRWAQGCKIGLPVAARHSPIPDRLGRLTEAQPKEKGIEVRSQDAVRPRAIARWRLPRPKASSKSWLQEDPPDRGRSHRGARRPATSSRRRAALEMSGVPRRRVSHSPAPTLAQAFRSLHSTVRTGRRYHLNRYTTAAVLAERSTICRFAATQRKLRRAVGTTSFRWFSRTPRLASRASWSTSSAWPSVLEWRMALR